MLKCTPLHCTARTHACTCCVHRCIFPDRGVPPAPALVMQPRDPHVCLLRAVPAAAAAASASAASFSTLERAAAATAATTASSVVFIYRLPSHPSHYPACFLSIEPYSRLCIHRTHACAWVRSHSLTLHGDCFFAGFSPSQLSVLCHSSQADPEPPSSHLHVFRAIGRSWHSEARCWSFGGGPMRACASRCGRMSQWPLPSLSVSSWPGASPALRTVLLSLISSLNVI